MGNELTGEQVVMDYQGHAIVECMGHQRTAGMVSAATIAGATMLRVDVPATPEDAAHTEYIHPNALYALTPCSEEVVLVALRSGGIREPISQYDVDRYRRLTEKEQREENYRPHLKWLHGAMLEQLVAHEEEKGAAGGWIHEKPARWIEEAQKHLQALGESFTSYAEYLVMRKHAAHVCNFVMMAAEAHFQESQGSLGLGPWESDSK